ncbi:hypothetical protein MKK55_28940 [Methylobacterium sp. J-059]|uniref:hypothetical protein n=1 Tax=Methylobacterium sp. J-059 TaxID=2836643 RepID=UPI001FBBFDD0|nr:hypothetical protein [Methylobacterium sp. J-059]MCJ2042944.1 hypothetical protein [Methylobacterium sp. J-059]
MSNVLTFTPRPKVAVPVEPEPMAEAEVRARLGEALKTALDAADQIIAVLDRIDGDAGAEDAGEAEPAPIVAERVGAQVVSLRGPAVDLRPSAPEIVLQDMPADPDVLPFAPLPWRGAGNVVAAAGVALLSMVGGR